MARKKPGLHLAYFYTGGLASLFILFVGMWLLSWTLWALWARPKPRVVITREIKCQQLEPSLPITCEDKTIRDDAEIKCWQLEPSLPITCEDETIRAGTQTFEMVGQQLVETNTISILTC